MVVRGGGREAKLWWLLLVLLSHHQPLESLSTAAAGAATPPPLPVLPIPTAAQLRWQRRELIIFFHFGMNTFTNSELGNGTASPSLFRPAGLNASQWVEVAAGAGASLVILTAKHDDGFCLWPSEYTRYSVASSPWKGGTGDVVRELVDAAAAVEIDVGIYLSPWDRHERSYGHDVRYNEFYMAQLRELLAIDDYGRISEVWFDGAKAANATNTTYYFDEWFSTVKQLQGGANIFSDAGPDLRWVGDESGSGGLTSWSAINRTSLRIGDAVEVAYLNSGDERGSDWVPPECDVSIRPGWFWHLAEKPKTTEQLLEIYYNSVGRNCVLLLNVPPNSTGLIPDEDAGRLREFRSAIDTIFSDDMAAGARATASSVRGGEYAASKVNDGDESTYWAPAPMGSGDRRGSRRSRNRWFVRLELEKEVKFNVVMIQEPIWMGQRVRRHVVLAGGGDVGGGGETLVANGTTVGYKRLHRLSHVVRARCITLRIDESRDDVPLISTLGLYLDPFN